LQVVEDSGEVDLVPAVANLSVLDVHEGGTGQLDGVAGGGEAKAVAGVGQGGGPADRDFVVLGDEFVDFGVNVGVGVVERAMGDCEVSPGQRCCDGKTLRDFQGRFRVPGSEPSACELFAST
jgi:hypothetical protein